MTNKNRTGSIVTGVALLALGIIWMLELAGLIHVDFNGWWTLFIIVPCLVSLFTSRRKTGPLIGLGAGILMLLATRDVILWNDFWKYLLCLVAIVWGLSLIFFPKRSYAETECKLSDDMKQVDQDGRQINKIKVSFSKQRFDFGGQRFEGADVQTSFGFTALNLREADLLDGAVVNVECSFGGMEIRVGKDVCVKPAIESAFGGVECNSNLQCSDGAKTLYIKGSCSFGGIEIK